MNFLSVTASGILSSNAITPSIHLRLMIDRDHQICSLGIDFSIAKGIPTINIRQNYMLNHALIERQYGLSSSSDYFENLSHGKLPPPVCFPFVVRCRVVVVVGREDLREFQVVERFSPPQSSSLLTVAVVLDDRYRRNDADALLEVPVDDAPEGGSAGRSQGRAELTRPFVARAAERPVGHQQVLEPARQAEEDERRGRRPFPGGSDA
mmetsp:Transcript_14091/g.32408  ORF Transcript_14091/g.32408 Transcript_14091/m.32408 type:complete len:208 (+) Transcript_14091:43-666(+)